MRTRFGIARFDRRSPERIWNFIDITGQKSLVRVRTVLRAPVLDSAIRVPWTRRSSTGIALRLELTRFSARFLYSSADAVLALRSDRLHISWNRG
jgi:hypothetical protein